MARRVVVTGAAGRLGGGIARRLEAEGRLLAGVDVEAGPLVSQVMDLARESPDLTGADSVIHAAAIPGPSAIPPPGVRAPPGLGEFINLESASPISIIRKNVESAARVFEAAGRGPGVERVVFSSSAFVMGWSHDARVPFAKVPLREEDGPRPFESYGLSKEMGESSARAFARTSGVEFVALRFTNIVKREDAARLPWDFDPRIPFAMWAWCHEDDVVDAHIRALDSRTLDLRENFQALLIAAPSTRFKEPTRDLVRRQFGMDVDIPGNASIFSCERAKTSLGWTPRCWTTTTTPPPPPPPPVLLLRRGSKAARQARQDPELREFPLNGFDLEDGTVLRSGALAYKVYGGRGSDRPVVLHPSSFGAVHTDLEYNIGPGKTLDTTKYRVVVCQLLGNGVSLSPSNSSYPNLATVGDNVRLQRRILQVEDLLQDLACVYGYSMGAMQAWEWARSFPGNCPAIAAVCGATGCYDYNAVFLTSLTRVLETNTLDAKTKLRLFGTIYAGWGVGVPFYRDKLYDEGAVEQFIDEDYVRSFQDDDPDDLLAMLRTWRAARPFDDSDLRNIRAACLLMPCDNDAYFRLEDVTREARLVPDARLAPLRSPYGHRAGDPWRPTLAKEYDHIRSHLHAFLDTI
ncbi:hypothetical protein CTAYLR_006339 [Chrysophaeum taylorii]|uniref:Uncharacterized protein n=1 Tax=Chrysophaeum taylorii TaxID=2483200 RepID=A0AAD7UAP2_9STRA|nr:hypothetical protein CTAYLR_006339 [Chrysophaeum taylorii]